MTSTIIKSIKLENDSKVGLFLEKNGIESYEVFDHVILSTQPNITKKIIKVQISVNRN